MNSNNDAALLTAWRGGCSDSGQKLFRAHFPSVLRFFRNKVSMDEVEDLVQRTFLALVEGRDKIREGSAIRSYTLSSARNILYSHFRAKSKDNLFTPVSSSIRDHGVTPSTAFAKNAQAQQVAEALATIPIAFQEILELHYWEGLDAKELGEVLEVSPTTARTRLYRARAKLRVELEKTVLKDIISDSDVFDELLLKSAP